MIGIGSTVTVRDWPATSERNSPIKYVVQEFRIGKKHGEIARLQEVGSSGRNWAPDRFIPVSHLIEVK